MVKRKNSDISGRSNRYSFVGQVARRAGEEKQKLFWSEDFCPRRNFNSVEDYIYYVFGSPFYALVLHRDTFISLDRSLPYVGFSPQVILHTHVFFILRSPTFVASRRPPTLFSALQSTSQNVLVSQSVKAHVKMSSASRTIKPKQKSTSLNIKA